MISSKLFLPEPTGYRYKDGIKRRLLHAARKVLRLQIPFSLVMRIERTFLSKRDIDKRDGF